MFTKHKINDSISYDPRTGEFTVNSSNEKNQENNTSVPDPEIVFFKSDKNILTDKNPATISWAVDNASDVRINKKPVASSGSVAFYSKEPEVITLIAKNKNNKSVSKSISIDTDRTP